MQKSASDQSNRRKEKTPYLRIAATIVVCVALVVVVLLNVFTHVFSVVRYYGDGMEPNLKDRQVLLVLKTDQVNPGDMAAFYYNNKVLVRRVIAGSGASLEISDSGTVKIDGVVQEEPYIPEPSLGQCNISFPYTVPNEEFFVMGDNRAIAMDSRLEEIGTIPRSRVIGKILFVIG